MFPMSRFVARGIFPPAIRLRIMTSLGGLLVYKKVVSSAAAAVLAIALAGCAAPAASSVESSDAASSEASSSSAPELEWPRTEMTEGVPVPQFSVSPESTLSNQVGATAVYKGVPDAEVEAYIAELLAAGYNIDVQEQKLSNETRWSARNAEVVEEAICVSITRYRMEDAVSIGIYNYPVMRKQP